MDYSCFGTFSLPLECSFETKFQTFCLEPCSRYREKQSLYGAKELPEPARNSYAAHQKWQRNVSQHWFFFSLFGMVKKNAWAMCPSLIMTGKAVFVLVSWVNVIIIVIMLPSNRCTYTPYLWRSDILNHYYIRYFTVNRFYFMACRRYRLKTGTFPMMIWEMDWTDLRWSNKPEVR